MGFLGVLDDQGDAGAHFFHGGGHGGGGVALFFRPLGHPAGGGAQLAGIAGHRAGGLVHPGDGAAQAFDHGRQGGHQVADFVAAGGFDPGGEVALGHPVGGPHRRFQGAGHPAPGGAPDDQEDQRHEQQGHQHQALAGAAAFFVEFIEVAARSDGPAPGRVALEGHHFFPGIGLARVLPPVGDDAVALAQHVLDEGLAVAVPGVVQVGALLGRVDGQHGPAAGGIHRVGVAGVADADRQHLLFERHQAVGEVQPDEEGADHLAGGILDRDVVGHEIPPQHLGLAGVGLALEQGRHRRVIGAQGHVGGALALCVGDRGGGAQKIVAAPGEHRGRGAGHGGETVGNGGVPGGDGAAAVVQDAVAVLGEGFRVVAGEHPAEPFHRLGQAAVVGVDHVDHRAVGGLERFQGPGFELGAEELGQAVGGGQQQDGEARRQDQAELGGNGSASPAGGVGTGRAGAAALGRRV